MPESTIRLSWITEEFQIWDSSVALTDLHYSVRHHIAPLLRLGDQTVTAQLPFLDRRELRRKNETFTRFGLRRQGDVIMPVTLPFATALATTIGAMVHTHPAWRSLPANRSSDTAFRISASIQRHMRVWLAARVFFQDANFFENRKNAWPLIVYAASRTCESRQKDYAWDTRDRSFPYLDRIGGRLEMVLAKVERILRATGRHELANKYNPIFHEDIRRAVLDRPGPLLHILARENRLIDAVIALADPRQRMERILPIAKEIERALRRVHGRDARPVALIALRAATIALTESESINPEDLDSIAPVDSLPFGLNPSEGQVRSQSFQKETNYAKKSESIKPAYKIDSRE